MRNQLLKTSLLSGLTGGVVFSVFFFIVQIFYPNPFLEFPKSLDFFIYLLTLVATMYYFRFRQNGGVLHFGQAFLMGIIVTASILLISVLFLWIYLYLINPSVNDIYASYMIGEFTNSKQAFIDYWNDKGHNGQDIYRQTMANLQTRDWPGFLMYSEILQKSFAGFFLTFIISAVMRGGTQKKSEKPLMN